MNKGANNYQDDNDIVPSSFWDLESIIDNINEYSTFKAKEINSRGQSVSKIGTVITSCYIFYKTCIKNEHHAKGINKIAYSLSKSMTSFLTKLKLLKLQGRI